MNTWLCCFRNDWNEGNRRQASLAFLLAWTACLYLFWGVMGLANVSFTSNDSIFYLRLPFFGLYMRMHLLTLLMIPLLSLCRPKLAETPMREVLNVVTLLCAAFALHLCVTLVQLDVGMTFLQRSMIFVRRAYSLGSTGLFQVLGLLSAGWLVCRLAGWWHWDARPLGQYCTNGLKWTGWLVLLELFAYEFVTVFWLVRPVWGILHIER